MDLARTEELYSLDKLVVLRQIDNHNRLDIAPIRGVTHDTITGKEDCNYNHDA